ncbi:MAG: hypothetical protein ACODAQ_09775 [Phycisphaeraceae bacterium]
MRRRSTQMRIHFYTDGDYFAGVTMAIHDRPLNNKAISPPANLSQHVLLLSSMIHIRVDLRRICVHLRATRALI